MVSKIAGTTIDLLMRLLCIKIMRLNLVDTAGVRRRGKILGIEKYALNRTEKMLESSDIAILLIDVTVGVTELDERVAGLIDNYKLGVLIVVNKWDIRGEREYEEVIYEVRDKLNFLHYAPILTVSAKSGRRVNKILDKILEIFQRYTKRIPTSKINEVISNAIKRHQIPSCHGQVVTNKFAINLILNIQEWSNSE